MDNRRSRRAVAAVGRHKVCGKRKVYILCRFMLVLGPDPVTPRMNAVSFNEPEAIAPLV
jgi:hypothetical protein